MKQNRFTRQIEKVDKMSKTFFTFLFSFVILAGCSNNDFDEPIPPSTGGDIAFNITIGGDKVQTRVATDADFKSTFETGDEVGIFAVKRVAGKTKTLEATGNYIHNAKLSYTGTVWSGELYYPNNDEVLDFYAYYPYKDNTDPTNMTLNVLINQSAAGSYSKSDLLSAKVTNIAKNDVVNLTFKHEMAMVQVNVEKGVDFPYFDGTFSVTLKNVQTQASFNWALGNIAQGTRSDVTMHPVQDMTNTYRALVPAQAIVKATDLFSFTQGSTTAKSYSTEKAITLNANMASVF